MALKEDEIAALFAADDPQAAEALQSRLARRVRLTPPAAFEPGGLVGGVDVAVSRDGAMAAAAAALWDPLAGVVEIALAHGAPGPAYRPGLLAFRETPLAIQAALTLTRRPDAWLYDGAGLSHPRRFGAACHFGLALETPTAGVAKSRPYAAPEDADWPDPGPERGAHRRAPDGCGAGLRTRAGVKAVWVSPGHLLDLDAALAVTLAAAPEHRLPEPLRAADHAARQALR